LKTYNDDRGIHAPEKARTLFKRYVVLEALGETSQANTDLRESYQLYLNIQADDRRPIEELTDDDFAQQVMFWSR
jgi:hypothetical protein